VQLRRKSIQHSGSVRRFLGASRGSSASISHSHKLETQLRSRVERATAKLVVSIYQTLIRMRRRVKPVVRSVSNLFDRVIERGGVGDRLLMFAYREVDAGHHLSARAALRVLRYGLMLAIQIHLGASMRSSAIRSARIVNLLYRSDVRTRRGLIAKLYFQALLLSTSYERIVQEAPGPESISGYFLNFVIGSAHLYTLHPQNARHFLERAVALTGDRSYEARRKLGCTYLLDRDYERAAAQFQRSAEIFPPSVMAHHNYAGRYDVEGYRPKDWEMAEAGRLLIYDDLIRLGEEFYLQGRFEDTFRFYQSAHRFQRGLGGSAAIPPRLVHRLSEECSHFDPDRPIRLLGYEWVTQIGHMGFLHWYLRMVRLGMIADANYVLLAPAHKVANPAFLGYLETHYCVVRDRDLVDELFPYQRFVGDQFIAFPTDGELAEPWAHAAARAQVAWTERGFGPLSTLTEEDRAFGWQALKRLGVPAGCWYVGLHVREGGFHGDGAGTTVGHRSADIRDYLAAVEEITSGGGWVIRLGDRSMTPLPSMTNVVDYIHSAEKSARMDVFLMATSRFVIGTTSGLTTATSAFGTPMLLVNCISNDCQFWTPETDFMVKPVYDRRRGRYLTLGETYRQPLHSLLINNTVLARCGYEVHNNSPGDIRAAVQYKLDCLAGTAPRADEDHPMIVRYRAALAHDPCLFGSALPVLPFLAAHPELLADDENVTLARTA
jgi:putative glycosyltransferase (TIGR04372 family)